MGTLEIARWKNTLAYELIERWTDTLADGLISKMTLLFYIYRLTTETEFRSPFNATGFFFLSPGNQKNRGNN